MQKVKLTKAQMGMLCDCMGGNIGEHAERVGKTFVEASREQFAYMEQIVGEFTSEDEWLLFEQPFESGSPQEAFFLRQKEKCVDNLVEKLSEVAYGTEK